MIPIDSDTINFISKKEKITPDKLERLIKTYKAVIFGRAGQNKIAIGINLKEISKLNKKDKAVRISRIKQNIKFCKKARTKLALINIKDKKDASNLLLSLGASTAQVKQTII